MTWFMFTVQRRENLKNTRLGIFSFPPEHMKLGFTGNWQSSDHSQYSGFFTTKHYNIDQARQNSQHVLAQRF